MIIFMGQFEAAYIEAVRLGLPGEAVTIACTPAEASRALIGADPDTTDVRFVYGSHLVVTPEIMTRIRILKAIRSTPEEVTLGELGIALIDSDVRSTRPALLIVCIAVLLLLWIGLPLLVIFG